MSKKQQKKDRPANNYKGRQNRKPSRAVEYQAILSMTREGFAFLQVSMAEGRSSGGGYFYTGKKTGGCFARDRSSCGSREIEERAQSGRRSHEVLNVLSKTCIGIVQVHDVIKAFVITDSVNMPFDIQLVKEGLSGG